MRIAGLPSDDQSQETCPDDIAAFERPRKGVQAAGNFSFPEKVPSPACRFRVAEEVTGFCFLETRVFLRVISVDLGVSVANVLTQDFTTEAQRTTGDSQREALRSISAGRLS